MLAEEKGTPSNLAQLENQGKNISQPGSSSTDSVSSSSGNFFTFFFLSHFCFDLPFSFVFACVGGWRFGVLRLDILLFSNCFMSLADSDSESSSGGGSDAEHSPKS